jgi:hypothetical protein
MLYLRLEYMLLILYCHCRAETAAIEFKQTSRVKVGDRNDAIEMRL